MMNEKLFLIRVLGVKLEDNRYQRAAKRSRGSIRKVPEEARLWTLAQRAEGQKSTEMGSIKRAFYPVILKQSKWK